MASSHPLLHVDYVLDAALAALNLVRDFGIWVGLLCAFQIAPEMLE